MFVSDTYNTYQQWKKELFVPYCCEAVYEHNRYWDGPVHKNQFVFL